ncbi:hypothetical protein RHGRI_027815 [Rhododendron griersonianum]|uniref:Ubiquitin-like domain-containing protein n=1 Tax=Rhododendron griersonianum TaxID=479676 RepID=A0AAV6J0I3_9ERIC|nr:hypothetical protein RHGRI_027815 [Rhododendron griersonianum]
MMQMKTKTTELSPMNGSSGGGGGGEGEWELRPGGMLVQKRTDSDQNRVPPPTIRVRVKYGSNYHEVNISSQSSFGELKKMLSGPTGLHHEDQKLLFRKKERDSKAFLDISGVKDRSKIVLLEDPISQEKRYLEMRKNAKMEKASKSISEISLEIDRLAGRKYVETLDVMKIKNSIPASNGSQIPKEQLPIHQHQQPGYSNGQTPSPNQQQQARHSVGHLPANTQPQQQQQQPSRHSSSGAVVITTQWETFDNGPAILQASPSTSSTASTTVNSVHPKFNWDLL